jgi:Putative peptidoglycan binding domain
VSTAVPGTATESATPAGAWDGMRPKHRRRRVVISLLILVVAAGATVAVVKPFGNTKANSGGTTNAASTSLATVTKRSLSSRTQLNGTLGYVGTYSVINQTGGTFTSLPAVGKVISPGQVLYWVDGKPVVLLAGSTPAYRSLSSGMKGADVRALNANLVALGYAKKSQLNPRSDKFGAATVTALKKLQSHLGLDKTGVLGFGQAVFLPTAARITEVTPTVGAPAQPGSTVIAATSTTQEVSIDLDAAQQSQIKVGDKVIVTLPNGKTTPGVVSFVGSVATTPGGGGGSGGSGGSDNSPTIPVKVRLTNAAASGGLDQAPVLVAVTTGTVKDVLVVPVSALLALAGGGYAVEVVGADGVHHLVSVTLGLFDDAEGLVQVSGSGLLENQRVVVPTS